MNASNSNAFSPKRWEQTERGEHDAIYRDSRPFDCRTYLIDPEHVIWWQDYCYKPGRRRDRGHRTRRVFELIDLESVKDKTILDVGCGNGQYSVFFALLGATAYGFDISPVGIEVARRMAAENGVSERCSFSVQNASNMDYPDEWFDIVLFHEVLHHAIKYPNVREETLRVLKTGGLAICAESLAGNKLLTLGRSVTMRGKEELGDVQLTIANLEEFSRGFSSS